MGAKWGHGLWTWAWSTSGHPANEMKAIRQRLALVISSLGRYGTSRHLKPTWLVIWVGWIDSMRTAA